MIAEAFSNGSGSFRINKQTATGQVGNTLEMTNITSGKVWLVADIAGWNYTATASSPSERVRFGFLDNDPPAAGSSTITAEMQIDRLPSGNLTVTGDAGGTGSTATVTSSADFGLSRSTPLQLILEVDADVDTYTISYKDGANPIVSLAAGNLGERSAGVKREARSVRFAYTGTFNEPGGSEFFDVERIYVTTTNPIPEPTCLALLGIASAAAMRVAASLCLTLGRSVVTTDSARGFTANVKPRCFSERFECPLPARQSVSRRSRARSFYGSGEHQLNAQQTATGTKFVVVSGHPASTAAGMAVLRSGGNVIDAAITTSLCLGVAEPYGSGIGGKGMMLYREGKTGRVYAIESMCAASKKLDAAAFAARPQRERLAGYYSVAVPGLVAGLEAAHKRWGSTKWHDLVAPAAKLAADGVEISEKMQRLMRPKRNLLRRDSEAARIYLVDGETPAVGAVDQVSRFVAHASADCRRRSGSVLRGSIAAAIVSAANQAGAPLTLEDFQNYKPRQSEPLVVDYDGCRVYSFAAAADWWHDRPGDAARARWRRGTRCDERPRSEVFRLDRPAAAFRLSASDRQDC